MAQELFYTSAPKGLRPGTSGFCTVAATDGLSQQAIGRLENLSGYEMLFKVGSPQIDKNPPIWAHWRPSAGGLQRSVVSYIKFAGMDHHGRTNKFAHHVVLSPEEVPAAGPAWLLRQPGFISESWTGEPRLISTPKAVPHADQGGRACHSWAAAAGDAAWAGVLAERFLTDGVKPSYVIYPLGMDALELIDEAVALLPAQDRWRVTFCTYFSKMPADLTCDWRFCVEGSPAVKTAQAAKITGSLVIDLTGPKIAPPQTRFAEFARSGEGMVPTATPAIKPVAKARFKPGDAGVPAPLSTYDIADLEKSASQDGSAGDEASEIRKIRAAIRPSKKSSTDKSALPDVPSFPEGFSPEGGVSISIQRKGVPPYFWVIAILWPFLLLGFGWMIIMGQIHPGDAEEVADLKAQIKTLEGELAKAKAQKSPVAALPTVQKDTGISGSSGMSRAPVAEQAPSKP